MKLSSATLFLLLSSSVKAAVGAEATASTSLRRKEDTDQTSLLLDTEPVPHEVVYANRTLQAFTNPVPVCETGTFQPNPNAYYHIKTDDFAKLWKHKIHERGDDQLELTKMITELSGNAASNRIQDATMWRFEKSGNNRYNIWNRFSGRKVFKNVQGTCKSGGRRVDFGLQSKVFVDRDRRTSGCKKGSRDCETVFSPGFEQIRKFKSNCFGGARRFECERLVPNSTFRLWVVSEVETFNKLSGPGLSTPQVRADQEPAVDAGQLIATLGTTAAGTVGTLLCPLCGGLFSVAASFGFSALNPGDMSGKLNQLADEILDATEEMIDNGIASESIRQFRGAMEEHRENIFLDYVNDKHRAFQSVRDGDEEAFIRLSSAHDFLEPLVAAYTTDLHRVFGEDASVIGQDRQSVQRSFLGFDALSYSVMELLAARQELYIMESYLFPTDSCQEIADRDRLDDQANSLLEVLQQTHRVMTRQRKFADCCKAKVFFKNTSTNPRQQTRIHNTEIYDGNKRVGRYQGIVTSRNPRSPKVAEIMKEREFDMNFISYPILPLLQYMRSYQKFSIDMCEAVRNDPAIRARFETDDINVVAP